MLVADSCIYTYKPPFLVEAGLRDRYKVEDLQRIIKFCQYSKKEIPLPLFVDKYHEPCEEYIVGLTAKPWWNKVDFAWSKDLESISDEIIKELNQFEAEQIFISDSRYVLIVIFFIYLKLLIFFFTSV